MMRVLVTGANGFLGRSMLLRLRERGDVETLTFTRDDDEETLHARVAAADWIYHFAGANRPREAQDFITDNIALTQALCGAIEKVAQREARRIPLVFASTSQAILENSYGRSKRAAEEVVTSLGQRNGSPVHIFRLPNVFGKWCRPQYNSVVATFCHNISRGLPIQIHDPATALQLVYVDDVMSVLLGLMDDKQPVQDQDGFASVQPQYRCTLGELASEIRSFRDSRESLTTERVGNGLTRALWATYLSYLSPEMFAYTLPAHADARGTFVEMLKTPDSGQFSYFTAHPGVTRGGHYHHTKSEKFLVVRGKALFKFRSLQTDERFEYITSSAQPVIVETVPGWAHDITNIGEDEMIVMLWASEKFDQSRPDTFSSDV